MVIQDNGAVNQTLGYRIAGVLQLALLASAVAAALYVARAPEPVSYVPDRISGDDSLLPSVVVVLPEPTNHVLQLEFVGNVTHGSSVTKAEPERIERSETAAWSTVAAMDGSVPIAGADATEWREQPAGTPDFAGLNPVVTSLSGGDSPSPSHITGGEAEGNNRYAITRSDSDTEIPEKELVVFARVPTERLQLIQPVVGKRSTVYADGRTYLAEVQGVSDQTASDGTQATVAFEIADIGQEPPLRGSVALISMDGPELTGVYRLPESAFRDRNSVWVVRDGKLSLTKIDVVAEFDGGAIVTAFDTADGVVVSPLFAPWDGLGVNIASEGW